MRGTLYILVIIAFLDNFIQLPIISPFAQSLNASPLVIGLVVGMYSCSNLIGNIIAGKWIDQFGAKIILIIGMATTAVVLLLYAIVALPYQLVIVRFLHGLTAGLVVPSIFTLISHRAQKRKQGRNMAYSGAAVGLAAIIGPALGGIIKTNIGIEAVFLFSSGLLALAVILAWFRLKEARVEGGQDKQLLSNKRNVTPSAQWIPLLRNPFAIQAYIGAFSLMFTMGVLTYVMPLQIESLAFEAQTSGMLFSTFGLIAVLIFVLPTNRIYDRLSSRTTMLMGMVIVGLTLLSLSFATQLGLLYGLMVGYGIGYALIFPSMNALLVENVPEADRGKAFGLFYAFFSIGVVVGSIIIGWMSPTYSGAFQITAGFILVVVLLIWLGGRRPRPKNNL